MTLAGVAQLAGCCPAKQRATGWFPVGAQAGVAGCVLVGTHMKGNLSMFLSRIDVSFPLSLPSPLSKHKWVKSLKEN